MLINTIFYLVNAALALLFSWLPDGTTLPTFGSVNLDTVFSNGVGYYRFLATIFPPLTTVLTAATIYLGFKVVMLIIKLILGSRTPQINTA